MQKEYEGTHGDFQWHTGAVGTMNDDFYSGSTTILETKLRDVSSVGSPVTGQALCKNGKTTKKSCDDVRATNVCGGGSCNLILMETKIGDDGDSGGPVFWSNTAYGLVKGWGYYPWPFNRDIYSRADRIDNAMPGVYIATW